MSFADLSTEIIADQGFEVAILNPKTQLPTGVYITIYGVDSEVFQNTQNKQQNRRLQSKRIMLTAEEQKAQTADLLAACTKSWRTVEVKEENGEKCEVSRDEIEIEPGQWFPCTTDNARMLYRKRGFAFVREQIDREMGDRANFLKD